MGKVPPGAYEYLLSGHERGRHTMLAGAIICIRYLANINAVILTDDSTEYSPITRLNNHR